MSKPKLLIPLPQYPFVGSDHYQRLGKSIVQRIWSGEFRLHYGADRMVAHDADGLVYFEWDCTLAQKIRTTETLKSERDPSGEFPFPESKIRGGVCL